MPPLARKALLLLGGTYGIIAGYLLRVGPKIGLWPRLEYVVGVAYFGFFLAHFISRATKSWHWARYSLSAVPIALTIAYILPMNLLTFLIFVGMFLSFSLVVLLDLRGTSIM